MVHEHTMVPSDRQRTVFMSAPSYGVYALKTQRLLSWLQRGNLKRGGNADHTSLTVSF